RDAIVETMRAVSRRRFLALSAAVPMLAAWAPGPSQPDLSALKSIVKKGINGDSIFGLDPTIANDVLLRATKVDSLPDGYTPDDIVNVAAQGVKQAGGQVLRALIIDDTRALIDAATDEGLDLYVGSGFRSQQYQAAVFAAQIRRWGDSDTANRYSAEPGHSQ